MTNRTVPPLSVRVSRIEVDGKPVAVVEVPKSHRLVATSDGTLQRRRLLADGRAECVPFLPHEFATREADLGSIDYSAMPVRGATVSDLDPDERNRLRRNVERFGGDASLLGLDDDALDGALGFVRRRDGERHPTVAGLLMIGKAHALREHVLTHEVAFQVVDDLEVRVNEFRRSPLLQTFEWIQGHFESRLEERELQVGMFRVAVPSVDRRAFREAVVNALTHRDYTRVGAVHVRLESDRLVVSNPGGFVDGVQIDNLLITEPRPRNPLLADVFKRVGLTERTGRGVDILYQGQLRYGRPAPDYCRSTATTVCLDLSRADADLVFLRLILEEEARRRAPLPVDDLIALALLREVKAVSPEKAAAAMQRATGVARTVFERLAEAGIATPHGRERGRTYTLSERPYRQLRREGVTGDGPAADDRDRERRILELARSSGEIRRADVLRAVQLSPQQATRMLRKLTRAGWLRSVGRGKGTRYVRGRRWRTTKGR